MAEIVPASTDLVVSSNAEPLLWDEAATHLAKGGTFWLTTVRPDGSPHVRPVLAVWVDHALHVVMSTSSRKWNNVQHTATCSIATDTPGLDLVIEGVAVRMADDAALRRVAAAYDSTYAWPVEIRDGAFFAEGAPTAGPPPFHVYGIRPATAYGFGTDEEHAARSTRWRFTPYTQPSATEDTRDAHARA